MGTISKDSGIEKDENLVAVVMADDFEDKFTILTQSKPKCLMTLANKEIIDYSLEFLQSCKVQDCYVYCSNFVAEIKDHLFRTKWLSSYKGQNQMKRNNMNVIVISNENCHSFGDAMRDLDEKGVLRDHFLLTSADIICNSNLEPLIKEHRRRYLENKNSELTIVYSRASPGHQSRSKDQEVLLLTEKESNRIIYHTLAKEAFQDKSKNKTSATFPVEIFQGKTMDEINIRYDLADSGIAICSPSVPLQFSERFDCQNLNEFIKGSIEDDLADHFLYASVLGDNEQSNGYSGRVSDFMTYVSVTNDVLNRWAYPFAPEATRTVTGKEVYSISRHNVYKARNVTLMKGSTLEEGVIIGENTNIGENSIISNAALGNNCKLGPNVSVRHSIIHDNVVIGSNCQVKGCIIGENAIIGANVVIYEKSIIGPGVHIKEDCKPIGPLTWIVAEKPCDEFDDATDIKDSVASDFGPKAFLFIQQNDDENSDSEEEDCDENSPTATLEDAWGHIVLSEDDGDDETSSISTEGSDDFPLVDDGAQDLINDADAKFKQFHEEVFDSLFRGFEDNTEEANLALEVNASRHAYNVTATQVVRSVIMNVFAIAGITASKIDLTPTTLIAEAKQKLTFFKKLIQRYVKNEQSEQDCMRAIEMYCWKNPAFLNAAPKVIHFMYDVMEILPEEIILTWFYNVEDDDEELANSENDLRKKLQSFVEWLEESEDESDDD